MGRLRIAFHTYMLPPEIGGPSVHTMNLADELGKLGHSVRVVALTVDGAPTGEHWELRSIPKAQSLAAKLQQQRAALAEASAWADVAIVQGGSFYGWWATHMLRSCPAVVRIPNSWLWESAWERGWIDHLDVMQAERQCWPPQMTLLRWMNRSYLRRAARVVIHADYARPWMAVARVSQDKVVPIPCGVPRLDPPAPEVVQALRAELTPDGAPLICGVGKLTGRKRFDRLVRLVADLPETRGVLVGDGELRQELEKRASGVGCGQRMTFMGSLPNRDALAVIAASDVLVITSDMEPFGIVSIEAMAMGTAVVAFALCALPETCAHGRTGYLVEPGDEDALRETVAYALAHPDETRAKVEAAREHVQRYHWPNIALEWEALLEDVVREDRR